VITVSGYSFNPNESIGIDWDRATTKVIGSAVADQYGNFTGVKVKPFAGDPPGPHKICATVEPQPCAQFELQGATSPTPSTSPLPSPSPSGSPSPSDSPTPSVIAVPVGSSSSLDVLLKPPFVFLPIVAILGVLAALAYWLMSSSGADRPGGLPSTSIVHRSVRPAFGGPAPDVAAAAPAEAVLPPTPPATQPAPPPEPPAPPPPPEDLTPPPLPPQAAEPEPPKDSADAEQPPWPKL
jgi:hypothetical protein